MNPIEAALRLLARALRANRVRWAVVGGLAVSARAEPRTTRDVDVAVAVADDRDAEHLVHRLRGSGYRVVAVVEHEASRRLATARLASPGEDARGIVADLLFASSGIEPEVVAAAELLEVLPGVKLPVARVGHLLALKVLARDDRDRPQDADDIRALLREATPDDLESARRALHLIAARGYQRGKSLVDELEAQVRQYRGE